MKNLYFIIFAFLLVRPLTGQAQQTENLFLITLDGFRWEELYGGADRDLITNKEYVDDTASLKEKFWAESKEERRKLLMPFFWNTISKNGQLYGNQWLSNVVKCSNPYWFSYPGYSEILCGKVDTSIDSNSKIYNRNKTFLEQLNQRPEYTGQVAAFASWDVFPYIINDKRSRVPVNAGFSKAEGNDLSDQETFLNRLQDEIPSPWGSVRLDAFTHHYALQYIKKHHPKVVYISYGETDDFAHDGEYDQYLKSAHRTDQFIKELWEFVQNTPDYKNKTSFVITTDHGRGAAVDGGWKHHGTDHPLSQSIWMAILGPDTPALGEVDTKQQLWQKQVASVCMELLGNQLQEKHQPVAGIKGGE